MTPEPRPSNGGSARGAAGVVFRCEVEPRRELVVVRPVGELDLGSAGELRVPLEELVTAGFARLVLDLRDLTFMDSTGLHIILDAAQRAREAGVELAVIAGPEAVQRVFEICGLLDHLPFRDAATALR